MKLTHRCAVLLDGNSIACCPVRPSLSTMSSANAIMSLWMKKLGHETLVSMSRRMEGGGGGTVPWITSSHLAQHSLLAFFVANVVCPFWERHTRGLYVQVSVRWLTDSIEKQRILEQNAELMVPQSRTYMRRERWDRLPQLYNRHIESYLGL